MLVRSAADQYIGGHQRQISMEMRETTRDWFRKRLLLYQMHYTDVQFNSITSIAAPTLYDFVVKILSMCHDSHISNLLYCCVIYLFIEATVTRCCTFLTWNIYTPYNIIDTVFVEKTPIKYFVVAKICSASLDIIDIIPANIETSITLF